MAQNYSVQSITDANLGDVVSAASGTSTFRSNASSGAVTLQSGSAVRLSNTSANAVVTIGCNSSILCTTSAAYVTLALAGTPTGRLDYIPSISVANGTGTITSAYSAGSYIVINLSPIPRNSTRTFLLGFDIPVLGNESSKPTGSAVSSYLITVSRSLGGGGSDSLVGDILAKVLRPIAIAKTQDLQFGSVTRPSSGSGSITVSTSGSASSTGTNVRRFSTPAPSAAAFTVTGEGGQAVTVSVPSTVTLSGPAGSVVASTTATGSGSQVLNGSAGAAGTVQVKVGGTVPLTQTTGIGTFSGALTVTVQYN
jgi:hypothetical protein